MNSAAVPQGVSNVVAERLACDGLAILHWHFSFSYVDGESDGSSGTDECRRLCQNSFTNGRNG
jgi:hypothetical protein